SSSSLLIVKPAIGASIRRRPRAHKPPIQLPQGRADKRGSPLATPTMDALLTSLTARLGWSRRLPETGTGIARADQATLGFYLLVAGSTAALAVTLFGARPHAAILLPVSLSGYPLAV